MKDRDKTKKQLIEELAVLHQRIAELKKSETELKQTKEKLKESEEKYRDIVELGEYIWFESSNQIIKDRKGQIAKIVSISRDITEHKKAEDALKQKTHELGKRVKELNCLYGIDKKCRQEGITIEEVLKGTVQLLPPSWQYHEIAGGCIIFEGKRYITRNFKETRWIQKADIIVNKRKAGLVRVCYLEKKPESDEGPFLKEERDLINAIAERLSQFIEHKHAQKALEESEKRNRYLSEVAFEGIAFHKDGILLNANLKFYKMWGYKPHELLGKQMIPMTISPESIESIKKKIRSKAEQTYEVVGLRKDGRKFPIEVHSKPVEYERHAVWVVAVRDISERKRTEEALRASEVFNFTLFQYNPIETIVVDREGRIIKTNLARRKSRDRWPNIGDVMYKDYAGKHDIDMHAELMECIKSKRQKEFPELKYGDKFLSITIAPFPEGAIITSQNITERKKAEKELKNSRTHLRELAAHLQAIREQERTLIAREMHDELGQSLTALKMDLTLLSPKLPKNQKSLLEKTKSMSKLIDKTLHAVKRISTELRPGLLDDLGLAAAIEWQGDEFQNRTGIRCEVTVDPPDMTLEQDRSTAIFRIFQEALTNIARHAHATRVKVSLKEKAGKVELRVRDNGIGITQEQISDSKSFGIIGIRERTQLFGGKIEIKGVQNKGTTLTISIPLPKKG